MQGYFTINKMPKIIFLQNTDSTNSYLANLIKTSEYLDNYYSVCALNQTAGRGIYNSQWHSMPGKNIAISILFYPEMKPQHNFIISMLVSLGICRYLKQKQINPQIKWPNDIYIENKKICGILIENNILASLIKSSIIGIGLNLNQYEFPDSIPNPISIAKIKKRSYSVKEEAQLMRTEIINSLKSANIANIDRIISEYLENLYRYNTIAQFKHNNNIISGKIINVKPDGKLIMEYENKKITEFGFKEIEYVIPK